jgi:hypothetical protein
MRLYTWTWNSNTRARKYQDPARQLVAEIRPVDSGYAWTVTQWGGLLAEGYATRLVFARTEAEAWITTATEVTPV